MLKGYRIAVIEDDEFMGASLVQRLELEGAEVIWLRQVVRALGALRTPRAPIDAVVCDIRLPDGTGEDLFTRLCETATPPPFLFVTGHGGIDQAVRLMRAGAADYITKPFEIPVLLERLAGLLATRPEDPFPPILGISPAARRVEAQARRIARADRSALIIGGPGTGKGLVARRIHDLSDRRAAPFEVVNLAREADAERRLAGPGGAIARTGEGTLFIHAFGLMGDTAAASLLAAVESGFAGRIIASCGTEIAHLRAAGGPRAELILRLEMAELAIPPLDQRPEDAVWLMHRLFAPMNARRDSPLEGISSLTEDAVRSHPWDGGGRELRARLARGVEAAPGPLLMPADLFHERLVDQDQPLTLAEARAQAERRHILDTLARCDGRIGEAARRLKVSRTTLWERMQRYGIARDAHQGEG